MENCFKFLCIIIIMEKNEIITLEEKLKSLSYHVNKNCNFKCRYCYAHFNQNEKLSLRKDEMEYVIKELYEHGMRKITFAGGEPTLISFLPELVIFSKRLGLTTVIITNGSRINQKYLDRFEGCLDWLGLSIDSAVDDINKKLGRGKGDLVKHILKISELARKNDIIIKINTVITSLNYMEDMNWFIEKIKPKRWKVFQMLPIRGENDDAVDLCITNQQFNYFLKKHERNNPIGEANKDMMGGYVMIDPEGRFFNNNSGVMSHGPSILDVGVKKAFQFSKFSYDTFLGRGGNYDWGAK